METTGASQNTTPDRPSTVRLAIKILGRLMCLAGMLSLFVIPFYLTLLLAVVGLIAATAASSPTPPLSWRGRFTLFGGCLVILGVLCSFGQGSVRLWRPHPATYVPTWCLCFYTARELLLVRRPRNPQRL
jgi:hypothetical protein